MAKTIKPPTAEHLPSGAWRCRVTVGGQRVSITRQTEKEAVAEAMAVKYGVVKSRKKVKLSLTLHDGIDKYIKDREDYLSPSTVAAYRVIQRNRMPHLMGRPLDRLTLPMIQRSMDDEAKQLAPKTISNTYGLLAAVLKDNEIDLDLSRLRRPRPERTEKRILQEDEIRRLMQALDGTEIECPVLLALMLGLRRSEICGLQWNDIDLKRRSIHVRRALVLDENRKLVVKGTKTVGSDRVLRNCPRYLMDRLDELPRSKGAVFTFSPDALSKRFDALLDREGLPHIGLHNLRHTWASVMLNLGAADKYTMALGGWSTPSTMKGIYQHTMDSGMKEATEKRNSFFSDLVKKPQKFRIIKGAEALKRRTG